MKILDNINSLWGNDLKQALNPGAKLDSLFSDINTTALVDTIHVLDDFELISFLVAKEAEGNAGRSGITN